MVNSSVCYFSVFTMSPISLFTINFFLFHCVKSVQTRSFSWPVFSCIRPEYGDLLRKFLYSVRIQEYKNQKKHRIGTLFMRFLSPQDAHCLKIFFDISVLGLISSNFFFTTFSYFFFISSFVLFKILFCPFIFFAFSFLFLVESIWPLIFFCFSHNLTISSFSYLLFFRLGLSPSTFYAACRNIFTIASHFLMVSCIFNSSIFF